MRHGLFLGVLALCCVASAQQAPPQQDTSPPLNEADKRTVAQITKLQQKIERLENEIETNQAKVEALTNTLSASARMLPDLMPKVAKVLNINGQVVIINAGIKGNGFRNGDKLLFARREGCLWLVGRGVVDRAYPNDAEGHVTENISGVSPEDEVYIDNRIGSPYSRTRIQLTPK